MTEKTTAPVADIEILARWEGKAEHAPGVLFEESRGDGMLAGEVALADLSAWVGLAAASGVIGNAVYEAIKAKVVGTLTAWRRQKGQAKLDELKQHVLEEVQKHAPNGKLTPEQLKGRIDAFFNEVQG
jgi:hypothetical protein